VIRYVTEADASGGAEVYVARLAAAFESDVVSAGPLPEATRALLRDVPVREVARVSGKKDVLRLLAFARALRGAGVVHVNANEPANNRYAMAAALLARVPYVVTLHAPGALSGDAQDAVLARLYRGAAAVIGVSQETAALVTESFGADAVVIPNGVALPPPVARDTAGRVRVGYLGRLSPEKGIDVLLAATRDLDVDVEVAGDGPLAGDVAASHANSHGAVADPAAFLAGIDVFVLASRTEGLPFALLEAMASGLPCVATAVGDVPEALDGVGIVVAPDDPVALRAAIDVLARDPLRRKELGAAARARVEERYAEAVMLDRTAAVYAAAGPAPRRRPGPAPRPGR
jgi:glycosyltransferase involved in cell wall biosynthesis